MNQSVHKTLLEMMTDRGYDSINELNNNLIITQRNNPFDKKLILNVNEQKTGVKSIKIFGKLINDHSCNSGMIIYKQSITSFAKSLLNDICRNIELFNEQELHFNITKHSLVPKHELLNESDKKQVLKSMRCNIKQLPFLLKQDPVCRYFNFEKYSVIKIHRKSETNGVYHCYRVVI